MMKLTILVAVCGLLAYCEAANWALLVAGSKTYSNYRHQADICHAFQILTKKGGFPASNVITMMYDDIANSYSNPTPGIIYNHPGGPDVYEGVQKDYTGDSCTAENFMKILSGDKDGMAGVQSEKVIESTSEDNVFVYFADHGGVGIVAMPTGPYLYADKLVQTLKDMAAAKKFKRLVFYMEACESGSMFADLPDNINIYAVTAANAHQSSYAYYYDQQRRTYLGDEFSIHWLENSDIADFDMFTLDEQYDLVANETKKSESLKFGQASMGSDVIGEYQAYSKTNAQLKPAASAKYEDSVSSRDVEVDILERVLSSTNGIEDQIRIKSMLTHVLARNTKIDRRILSIIDHITGNADKFMQLHHRPKNFNCLRRIVDVYENKCGQMNDYSLKYVRQLVNLCEEGYDAANMREATKKLC